MSKVANLRSYFGSLEECYELFFFQRKLDRNFNSILDIGCGDGSFVRRFFTMDSYVGCDIERSFWPEIQRSYGDSATDISFVAPDELHSLPAESCAAVVSVGLMELIGERDINCYLGKSHRLLEPSGKMLLIWSPWCSLSATYIPYLLKGGKRAHEENQGQKVYTHSLKDICKLIKVNNLQVLEAGYLNPFPSLLWRSKWLMKNMFATRRRLFGKVYGGRYLIAEKKQ